MLFLDIKKEILQSVMEDQAELKKREAALSAIRKTLENIKKKADLDFEIFLGGSIAKGTNIKGSDVDVFILFDKEFDPLKVLKELKKAFKDGREEYSEHPYLIIDFDTFSADIVPAYKLSTVSSMVTSVDRTPLHVEFVKSKFTENMKNEARILKQFMKGIGVYGAESSIQGFSGYVSELLIHKYHTFDRVISEAARWTIPFSVEGSLSKFKSANLVITDPVDEERNAAANVSLENLATMILASRLFRLEDWRLFFFPEKEEFRIPAYGFVVSIECKKCNEEVLLPNLRRIATIIKNDLDREGFRIIFSSVFLLDRGYIVLIPENVEINDVIIHEGPPVTNGRIMDFLEKWGGGTAFGRPFINGDRIYVLRETRSRTIHESLSRIVRKVKLANDFSKDSVEILNIDDKKVPAEIKKGFLRPSLGRWSSVRIKDTVEQ